MSSPRPCSSTGGQLRAAWHRSRQWIRRETRLGITTRLSIAFAAVTTLAIAANAITEYGVAVVRAIELVPVSAQATPEPAGQDAFPVALEHFQHAVLARMDGEDAARVHTSRQATAALTAAHREFAAALAPSLDSRALGKLDADVKAHRERAAELVRKADTRRHVLAEYDAGLDTLDRRLTASQERAWKIFGKVVSRQYLLDATRMVAGMRVQAERLAVPGGYDGATVQALATNEAALGDALRDNERSIIRALGKEWLAQTRHEFDALVKLREGIVRSDRQRRAGIDGFLKGHAALAAQVRKKSAAYEAATAVATVRRQSAEALSAIAAQEHRQRTLLAWLSGGVLLLILLISLSTVMSVVMPVRRLMHATRRLAAGESGVIVPRGGLRELDALAVSFNHMAEQLAAAQDLASQYHEELETRVEERTRQLQHIAEHDPLTRLPNRRQLFAQLDVALAAAAERGDHVGVFFLDLDHFKNINDSMGHVFGDRVLQTIAERLRGTVADYGFCARLGGDEFTVVYERASGAADIENAGRSLVRAFQQPLIVDGRELLMSISVGASIYPEHATDAESLLSAADAALFRAKALGRSQLGMFSPDLLQAAATRFTTEQGLRRAVERGEFELFFQPEVNLPTLETGLVEALLRWRPPGSDYVSPQDFLQVAEDCGLISDIGDWVLQSAIETAVRWRREEWPGVRVAVNVSSREMLDSQFAANVERLLSRHGLPPACLEIELTENVLQTGPRTIEALRQLQEIGVGVALDDFGTGYSSLASLEQLPLSRVKLDRSLIETIDTSTRSQAITRAIIALCQNLGLAVTAEGIERAEQLEWLHGHPAMYLQGHLLSHPVPAGELVAVIAGMRERLQSLLMPAGESQPRLRRVR